MGDQLTIHATAWPRNGRLGHRAVGLESSWDVRSRAQILAWRNGLGTPKRVLVLHMDRASCPDLWGGNNLFMLQPLQR